MFDAPNKFSLLKFLTDLPIVFVSRVPLFIALSLG